MAAVAVAVAAEEVEEEAEEVDTRRSPPHLTLRVAIDEHSPGARAPEHGVGIALVLVLAEAYAWLSLRSKTK